MFPADFQKKVWYYNYWGLLMPVNGLQMQSNKLRGEMFPFISYILYIFFVIVKLLLNVIIYSLLEFLKEEFVNEPRIMKLCL